MSDKKFDNIKNAAGERLDVSFVSGTTYQDQLMILGHGVTANKDRDWAVDLERALVSAGYSVLRFSFAGNGESEGQFGDSHPTKESDDLKSVIDHCDGFHVTYIGHSMGGTVGVLRTSQDSRIKRLISLAGMVHTQEFSERKFGELKPGEFMWDKPECPLSEAFLADMKSIDTVLPLVDQINVPWLLVHGDADTVVLHKDSDDIKARKGEAVTLVTIPGADHLFSGAATKPMCEAVVNWLANNPAN